MKLTIHRKTPVGTISVEEEIPIGTEPDAIRRMLMALNRACAATATVRPDIGIGEPSTVHGPRTMEHRP